MADQTVWLKLVKKTYILNPYNTKLSDESMFGKRKYNRGRLKNQMWILGGVCRIHSKLIYKIRHEIFKSCISQKRPSLFNAQTTSAIKQH